jgi:hypothetical protein
VLSFRKVWTRMTPPRSASLDIDPAFAYSVDELFDPGRVTKQAVVAAAGPARSNLSNAELSHAWRASYRALGRSHDPRELARIAAARARYLDAVQERDPAGFARWVCSEGAAGREPAAFFRPDRPLDV